MTFTGVHSLAVLAAAVAAWLTGALWYMALGRQWLAALGKTEAQIKAKQGTPGFYLPFVLAFVADLLMAWVLAGIIGHAGPVTLRAGVITAALCWLGFVITTITVTNGFAGHDPRLLWIDGGHWLLVLLVMGAILGGMG
jgi:hypothetical protein